MSAKVFTDILKQGIQAGKLPARTAESRKWFRNKAQTASTSPSSIISSGESEIVKGFTIGDMILFNYDPKTKADLPYYDTFPLIFPIGPAAKGFYGINLHYLPHRQRAILMDALYTISTDNRYTDDTKLRISYEILKSSAKFKWFKPCVKHYLSSKIKSRRVKIHPTEWDIALFLPLERFKKASKEKVWEDSIKRVRAG